VIHGISAGVISGAGWSEHMGVLLGTGRCDIAKTPTLSKRFTVDTALLRGQIVYCQSGLRS
jgi:hypothetical protein